MKNVAASCTAAVMLVLPVAYPACAVAAGAYPERAIRLVCPFPAGGGVDIVSRIVAAGLSEAIGQQVVVENRTGASGIVGTEFVANAAPDGYTLVMGNVATHAVNVSLFKKLSYDPLKDFAPISRVAELPEVLLIHPSVPARSVKELIAFAKARPGELTYGSAGSGTPTHLAAELFKSMAGVNIVHVPYKGTPPAMIDLMAGQVTMIFSNILSALPPVKAGKLRALGVSSLKRARAAPDIPTISESGLPGFYENSWYGVLAPAGTPAAVVSRLNAAVVQTLKTPAVAERIAQQGAEVTPSTPGEFRDFMRSEIERYGKIVKASGLRVD
jgi:tripartite-type tricarboxylate transporter receptor subunit TctC